MIAPLRKSVPPIVASLVLVASCGSADVMRTKTKLVARESPVEGAKPVAEITREEVAKHLRILAADKMGGRAVATPGLEKAVVYLEGQFQAFGLKRPFDGSYRQSFSLRGSKPDPEARLSLRVRGRRPIEPTLLENFVVGSHRDDCAERVQGQLVYVGYGIEAPGREWDDIKGVDLKDKVLLMEVNEPENRQGGRFDGTAMTYYGRWTYKFEQAHRLGAKGVLLIHEDKGATYGWSVVRNSWSKEEFFLPSENIQSCFHGWIDRATAVQVLKAAGLDRDELFERAQKPEFKPISTKIEIEVEQKPTFRTVSTDNVAGIIPGGRASEDRYVVLSAHIDHLGTQSGVEGDAIFNGAVDNAAATAVLLGLARRLSERRAELPVHVIVFGPTAEEVGLLGSQYFTREPPVPVSTMLANINLELTNVWGPTRDVYAIGSGQSELDAVCREAADTVGLTYLDELDRENGFFFRSDQISFARAGVPGVWLHEGPTDLDGGTSVLKARLHYRSSVYHTVDDEVDPKWDLRGAVQKAKWSEAIIEVLGRRNQAPAFAPTSAFYRDATRDPAPEPTVRD